MAVLFALYGLLSFNVLLVLIAAFVYMGAMGEQARSDLKQALSGTLVLDVMSGRLGEARVDEPAGDVARRLFREHQEGALVVDGDGAGFPEHDEHDHVVGIVMAKDLSTPALMHAPSATVASVVRREMPRVHTRDDASTTLDPLMNGDVDAVVVLDESEHIVGLVTAGDVQRAMTFLGVFTREHRDPDGTRPGR